MTSRLYSAIAAGCIPVVVADRLSGAFASLVGYQRFWLRVSEHAFLRDNSTAWLAALRALPAAEVHARRRRVMAARADVVYDGATSRVAHNFLQTAYDGCVLGRESELLGTRHRRPGGHLGAGGPKAPSNCTCVRRVPHCPPLPPCGPPLASHHPAPPELLRLATFAGALCVVAAAREGRENCHARSAVGAVPCWLRGRLWRSLPCSARKVSARWSCDRPDATRR